MEHLNMTSSWDKVFPQSDKVNHSKIAFQNRYGITLAADLYVPKNATGKLPAIAVSGPFGAVKEQSSGLYAQTMAEQARYEKKKAHSRYFSETACKKLTGDNKELMIIPDASHVDLYDRMDVIPFDKIGAFFKENLK